MDFIIYGLIPVILGLIASKGSPMAAFMLVAWMVGLVLSKGLDEVIAGVIAMSLVIMVLGSLFSVLALVFRR